MDEKEATRLTDKACEYGVPHHLIEGMVQYIVVGRPLGAFLTAVMENNLMEAYGLADVHSSAGMKQLCEFIYNEAPNPCHGSPERVKSWYEQKNEERRKRDGRP